MSNDLLSNYDSSAYIRAIGKRAHRKYISPGEARDLLFGYSRCGDAKNFEVVARGGIENSADSAVAFSMASCFIFNAPSRLPRIQKEPHYIFFASHVIYTVRVVDTKSRGAI